ncbi:dipeptidase [Stenotrophomonas mori]|uniref:Dipeptidase n=1 Tax=Stenotrophomonas mori TaxID=2871096 RepID=A0ABT0SJ91_9GAMM|nr:dipeptidase [Stenotrophomonas mori]MCL7715191.1 dipeptidase [Stenotrophomonas mori]
MKFHPTFKTGAMATALLLAFATTVQAGTGPTTISERARAIQAKAINLDTHLDTPALFSRPGWKISDRHSFEQDGSQIDYPRMVEGGLDGGFWVVFTSQGERDAQGDLKARDAGLKRLSEIREMVAANADKFELATTADDAARIKAAGKKSVYISMENAYPLEHDPSLLSFYYKQGLRMISLAHISHNDFADSAGMGVAPEGEHGGLSDKGKAMIAEANRLGIILDQSHASNTVFDQMLALSKAPIILSHSGAYDVFAHSRNIDDARIRALASKGGVIQVNSLGGYLIDTGATPEYREEMRKVYAAFGGQRRLSDAERAQAKAKIAELDRKHGIRTADFDDYMRHLLHIIEVAGWEHVGLGADWDGGGGVEGYEDITALPKVVQALLDAGYDERQIGGILGGNTVRLIREVQALADPEAVKAALE